LPSTKLFPMDLDKAVLPWRRKSWSNRYSNTMRMQNQAKLAAGAHRGHKYMSKCLHNSATAMLAAACTQLPFGGGILLIGSKTPFPNI